MDTRQVARQIRLKKWSGIIAEHHASGQTVRQFCAEHNLSQHAYYYWLKLVREAACANIPAQPDSQKTMLVPLQIEKSSVPSNPSKLVLHYGEFTLDVYASTPDTLFKHILTILQQVHSSC